MPRLPSLLSPFRRRAGGRSRGGAVPRRPSTRRGREFTNLALGRAERPREPRHIPWRGMAVSLASIAILGGLVYGGMRLYYGDTFRVQEVDVLGGQITDPAIVAQSAALAGESLFTLDEAAAAARIEVIPGVKDATVTADWPHGATIQLEEHQGWGYWQVGGRRVMIDAQGQVLARAREPGPDAPTIIEVAAEHAAGGDIQADPDTVRLVARLLSEHTFQEIGVQPESFVFRHDRGLTVVTEGGPNVIFGDTNDYAFKVATWDQLLGELEQSELAVAEIDLRFGQNVVLR